MGVQSSDIFVRSATILFYFTLLFHHSYELAVVDNERTKKRTGDKMVLLRISKYCVVILSLSAT